MNPDPKWEAQCQMNRDAIMMIFESEPPYSMEELMKDTGPPIHIANIMFPLAGDMMTAAQLTEKL